MTPFPATFPQAKTIQQCKEWFAAYNIAHLRELIRYLSDDKFELFHTLPFLLHVNDHRFPGYVENTACPYGIFGFQDSGFWKMALKHFKYSEKELMHCLSAKFHIQGLYLMGSSGTLAQGDHSDLDYWLLVDEDAANPEKLSLLNHKLSLLENWAHQAYHQQVTFFVMTTGQVRHNQFRQVDEESSGTIQQTILKEEFYRTFIMIAGRIPYWAIFPVGLSSRQYGQWIQAIETDSNLLPDQNGIDLGYPHPVDKKECPGALLWQMYKARHDPVKSYIKASLIAAYFNEQPGTPLPCDTIRKRFPEKKLDCYTVDPYSIIFEKTLHYYERNKQFRQLALLQECLVLRILGYPLVQPDKSDSPKADLLRRYLTKWNWDGDKIERFYNYPNWPEPDKLDYEVRIIGRIATLYTEMEKSSFLSNRSNAAEIQVIRNRNRAVFQTRPHKIKRCSAYIKALAEAVRLKLYIHCEGSEKQAWVIEEQDRTGSKQPFQRKLLSASGPAHLAGWLAVNRLPVDCLPDRINLPKESFLTWADVRNFLDQALTFLNNPSTSPDYKSTEPVLRQVLVAVASDPAGGNNCYQGFDFLLVNDGGEIFHHELSAKDIENNMLKCYKLGKSLFSRLNGTSPRDLQYLFLTPGSGDDGYARKTTLEFMEQLEEEAAKKTIRPAQTDGAFNNDNDDPNSPFLDRL